MCSLLPIKHIFFETCKYSTGLTGSTVEDILIMFLNFCNHTTFNRDDLIKVILYENAEKIGANTATGNFADVSKSSYFNFKYKFSVVQ